MSNFKIGDKVRILDNTKILLGFDLTVGNVYEVLSSNPNRVSITDDAGDTLMIVKSEFPAVEKVKCGGGMIYDVIIYTKSGSHYVKLSRESLTDFRREFDGANGPNFIEVICQDGDLMFAVNRSEVEAYSFKEAE